MIGTTAILVACVAILCLSYRERARQRRSERLLRRMRTVRDLQAAATAERVATHVLVLGMVRGLGETALRSGILSGRTRRELEETLEAAGFAADRALALFLGMKLLLATVLPVCVLVLLHGLGLLAHLRPMIGAASIVAGMMLPDLVIRRLRARTLARLDAGLPDALDLMVICAEAGLALEPTISRVSNEIGRAHPAIALEFERLSRELQLISDPKVSLANIARRTGLAGLKQMANVLSQSIQYGTPLAHALRVLSTEMRRDALLRFEERAARLPVMLTLPMIVFILPTIFLVVGGPAAITVLHHGAG